MTTKKRLKEMDNVFNQIQELERLKVNDLTLAQLYGKLSLLKILYKKHRDNLIEASKTKLK